MRKKVSARKDKKIFTNTANRMKAANLSRNPKRGGIRL